MAVAGDRGAIRRPGGRCEVIAIRGDPDRLGPIVLQIHHVDIAQVGMVVIILPAVAREGERLAIGREGGGAGVPWAAGHLAGRLIAIHRHDEDLVVLLRVEDADAVQLVDQAADPLDILRVLGEEVLVVLLLVLRLGAIRPDRCREGDAGAIGRPDGRTVHTILEAGQLPGLAAHRLHDPDLVLARAVGEESEPGAVGRPAGVLVRLQPVSEGDRAAAGGGIHDEDLVAVLVALLVDAVDHVGHLPAIG